jgi:ketosteroid isomerase-like protein
MARSPQEVFAAHAAALADGDIAAIVEDYSADAVLVTPQGPIRGRDGIGEFFAGALAALPLAEFTLSLSVFAGDVLLLQWSATSAHNRITDAVDTFVFAEGLIRLQTTVFRLDPGPA